jgi:hypothetical protein
MINNVITKINIIAPIIIKNENGLLKKTNQASVFVDSIEVKHIEKRTIAYMIDKIDLRMAPNV